MAFSAGYGGKRHFSFIPVLTSEKGITGQSPSKAKGEPSMKDKVEQRTFAVASLGRGRWYWVVWPSLAQMRGGEARGHLAEGFASDKLTALDQALAIAGADAQWLAAGAARRYYAGRTRSPAQQAVAKQEFLYYDVRGAQQTGQKGWRSLPYLVVKCTAKFVYVAATPYEADKQTGDWAGERIRLERASLEKWGYAFIALGDADHFGLEEPLFYTTPYSARASVDVGQGDCFALLEMTPPFTVAAVKRAYRRLAKQHHPDRGGAAVDFLALQTAYRQALEQLGE
jgi:hypothetical protein